MASPTPPPTHDTDHDGLSNFTEYAFGLDPTTGAGSPPVSILDKTIGTFTYKRPAPALTGVIPLRIHTY